MAYTVSVMEKEIEELRAENERLKGGREQDAKNTKFAAAKIMDQQTEIEKLKEALRFYAECKHICIRNDKKAAVCFEPGTIARKALGGEG